MSPEAAVARWLDEAVIGLDLCPFAQKVRRQNAVRIVTLGSHDPIKHLEGCLNEAQALIGEAHQARTTLIVIPEGLEDFEIYLDLVATLEEALSEAGAEGHLQVASFHPRYRFEGEDPEGVSHFTNRAPYPLVHLLREDDVSEAISRHPDPEGIPGANIDTLNTMGLARVQELWRRWSALG